MSGLVFSQPLLCKLKVAVTTMEREGDKAGCGYGHPQLVLIYILLYLIER